MVEKNEYEKDFAVVDYSGIEDVDRPYTLDKLIKGGGAYSSLWHIVNSLHLTNHNL